MGSFEARILREEERQDALASETLRHMDGSCGIDEAHSDEDHAFERRYGGPCAHIVETIGASPIPCGILRDYHRAYIIGHDFVSASAPTDRAFA